MRILLLTTQRFDKVLTMQWADIDAEGVWTIPTVSKREKPHGGSLKLPQLARDLLAALPVFEGNPFVFAGRGQGHINSHSKNKARLDQASSVTGWVPHDLRRTAPRPLGPRRHSPRHRRENARPCSARRRNVYDRHRYLDEKADALATLAALIERVHHASGFGAGRLFALNLAKD